MSFPLNGGVNPFNSPCQNQGMAILNAFQNIERFVALRRDIHAHPELAYEENRTSDIVAGKLKVTGNQMLAMKLNALFGLNPADAAITTMSIGIDTPELTRQKVREAERDRQYDEFKDRIGTVVNGLVKRVEYGNVIVDLGRSEGIVRRDELIPREVFRPGDRIRAFVFDVRREARGLCGAEESRAGSCRPGPRHADAGALTLQPTPADEPSGDP